MCLWPCSHFQGVICFCEPVRMCFCCLHGCMLIYKCVSPWVSACNCKAQLNIQSGDRLQPLIRCWSGRVDSSADRGRAEREESCLAWGPWASGSPSLPAPCVITHAEEAEEVAPSPLTPTLIKLTPPRPSRAHPPPPNHQNPGARRQRRGYGCSVKDVH